MMTITEFCPPAQKQLELENEPKTISVQNLLLAFPYYSAGGEEADPPLDRCLPLADVIHIDLIVLVCTLPGPKVPEVAPGRCGTPKAAVPQCFIWLMTSVLLHFLKESWKVDWHHPLCRGTWSFYGIMS